MFFLTLFYNVLHNSFECSIHDSKIKFIILNSYEHFKPIESNPQFNPVETIITHFYSDSSVYHQIELILINKILIIDQDYFKLLSFYGEFGVYSIQCYFLAKLIYTTLVLTNSYLSILSEIIIFMN